MAWSTQVELASNTEAPGNNFGAQRGPSIDLQAVKQETRQWEAHTGAVMSVLIHMLKS